jgi:transcriptional regulator of acetoin/glycerol metabolism
VRPVGGTKRQVDVLLVSATNADLDQSIGRGRFRSDLLFRLNTLEVTLPPLRERSDFADIARHLMARIDPSAGLTQSAIDQLAEMAWDGNIRQLRNALSRLSLHEQGGLIDGATVCAVIGEADRHRGAAAAAGSGLRRDLRELQRAQLLTAYAEAGNNISKAARRLGVSRNMIYRALRNGAD